MRKRGRDISSMLVARKRNFLRIYLGEGEDMTNKKREEKMI